MSRAAVAVLLTAAAAAGAAGVGCTGGSPGAAPAPGSTTTTTIHRSTAVEVPLQVGECGTVASLRIGAALDPAALTAVDCTTPHDVEVIAVLEYPADTTIDFPGQANVDGYATDQCLDRFQPYVGEAYESSHLDVVIVAPDEDGWGDGDRRIACVVHDVDFLPLTATVAAPTTTTLTGGPSAPTGP